MTSERKQKLIDHGRALWLAGVPKEQLYSVARRDATLATEVLWLCIGWNDCQRRFENELVR